MVQDVLSFWFEEIERANWFRKDLAFDALIVSRFSELHAQAKRCELYQWRTSPQGRLAEIIVLDQFSRNMFRGKATSFSSDSLALALAQVAIAVKADQQLNPVEKSFLYMPFMHSESPVIHATALHLYQQEGLENNLNFEIRHKDIIDQFGRYPHRNEILGRESSAEELEFLSKPGSGF